MKRFCLQPVVCLVGSLLAGEPASPAAPDSESLVLHVRSRAVTDGPAHLAPVVEREWRWNPRHTALVVCDLWDRHWCRGATERVAELAPRIHAVLREARARGALIVHAPSETMAFYRDHPQRQRALAARARAPDLPPEVNRWRGLQRDREPPLPVDDRDGGCDDDPSCRQPRAKAEYPWRRQIATLDIAPEDVISDRADEILAVFRQAGITNVILLGVHANMCVLGRSFGIRALVGEGLNVLLMRDLTDTMYNSRRPPYVGHFAGTDLVVAHIEAYWCPTVTSTDFLGGEPFRFRADRRPRVVLWIGEDEYRTWETLPRFAREELAWRGLDPVVVTEDPVVKHHFPGLDEALRDTDLLVVSTRRRALAPATMAAVRAHLEAGRPLVGLRTASHAFAPRGDDRAGALARGLTEWPEFDAQVLGGNYQGHHDAGPITQVRAASGAEAHPLLRGLDLTGFASRSSLYRSGPVAPAAEVLLWGEIRGQPPEPVAWTHRYGPRRARVFYTSLGGPEDFDTPAFRRLLLNGILWALDRPVPP